MLKVNRFWPSLQTWSVGERKVSKATISLVYQKSSSNWETISNPRSLEFVRISKNSFNPKGKQIEFWRGSNWSKNGNNWPRILWKSSKIEMPSKIDLRVPQLSWTRTTPQKMYFIKRMFTKTSIMLCRSLWISHKSNIASKINLMPMRQSMRSGN